MLALWLISLIKLKLIYPEFKQINYFIDCEGSSIHPSAFLLLSKIVRELMRQVNLHLSSMIVTKYY